MMISAILALAVVATLAVVIAIANRGVPEEDRAGRREQEWYGPS